MMVGSCCINDTAKGSHFTAVGPGKRIIGPKCTVLGNNKQPWGATKTFDYTSAKLERLSRDLFDDTCSCWGQQLR